MVKKKMTLQEAQQEYYSWLVKGNVYDEETAKKFAFRTEKEIEEYEKAVLEYIDKRSGKFPRSAKEEKKTFKNLGLVYKIQAMHYYPVPETFVDMLFL